MRKSLGRLAILTLLALPPLYVAYPIWTAWSIREAIRSGDSAYLEHRLDWPRVRETLRASMTDIAVDMPQAPGEGEAAAKPGLWQRLKAYVGRSAVDRFVEAYVTPEGLPQLFTYRKIYRQNISGEPDETTLAWSDRFSRFWTRLKRAEFQSLTRFEIEMVDRYDATRHHVGLFELKGFNWILTELRVRSVDAAVPLASAILPTDR